jgi:hypothetical protein
LRKPEPTSRLLNKARKVFGGDQQQVRRKLQALKYGWIEETRHQEIATSEQLQTEVLTSWESA